MHRQTLQHPVQAVTGVLSGTNCCQERCRYMLTSACTVADLLRSPAVAAAVLSGMPREPTHHQKLLQPVQAVTGMLSGATAARSWCGLASTWMRPHCAACLMRAC
jgi:hypothetical protein